MNRTRALGIFGLLIIVAGAVFGMFHYRGGPAKSAPDRARSAEIKPPPIKAGDHAAPRGMAPQWAFDADPEGPIRLEGQVVDADGHGVAGAEVWLGSVPPRTAKTEGDGTFSFDKLVGRTYPVSARAGALIGGPVEYKLTDKSDPVIVKVGAGARVEVTVLEEDKRPVANADVRLAAEDTFTAKTGNDGKATLAPVHPGWVSVQVTAPGHAPGNAFTSIGSAGATGQLQVTLHKGVAVTGRVVDEAGKPIAKARITTSGIWDIPGGLAPTASDDKGQFTIPAIAAGHYTLVATDGDHAPARSAPLTIADHAVTNVTISMKAGGTLAGTVVDSSHTPVPFATLRVAGKEGEMWLVASRQTTADRAGKFELRGLARTKLRVRAESDAAASKLVDVDLAVQSAKRDAEIVLDVSGTIAGVVVDDHGQPVPEVTVNAMPDILDGADADGMSLAGMSSATPDGAGAFTVRGLPDGPYKLSAARQGGIRDWGQRGTPAKTGETAVKIVHATPGVLIGKIAIDGASAPPSLAIVQLGWGSSTPATAGAFRIDELAPGEYDAQFHGPEFADLTKHDIKIEAGKTTDLGTVVVSHGRRLVGTVVDRNGAPVAGAKVKVGDLLFQYQGAEEQMDSYDQASGARVAVSDQDGAFTLIGIPKKHTSVMADHPDRGRSNAAEIADGEDDPPPLTLALRGFGSITGTVTLKGQPASGVTITDSPKDGGSQMAVAQTDDTGAFTLAKAPEGTHVLSAMQQGGIGSFKSTSTTAQVVAGAVTTVALDIPVGTIALTIQIRALPNNEVDAAQVFLFRGVVSLTNAKDLTQGFLGGGVQGMKIWFGAGKPLPEFDELIAGDYSACSIPITGSLSDPNFQQRIQEHMDVLKVYCKPVTVTPSPDQQTLVQDLPSMVALSTPKT